jgi:tRNA threonylcarbamoyladenosine biosynthesis protein TsaE
MSARFTTESASATAAAGRSLASVLVGGDVVALEGDLGAGKTTLARGVAEALGVAGAVTSPTFNILMVHPGEPTLYHFDLYRLDAEDQLEDIAFWEMLEAGGVSLIEWGDRFPDALPSDVLHVEIAIGAEGRREFRLSATGTRSARIASAWMAALETSS